MLLFYQKQETSPQSKTQRFRHEDDQQGCSTWLVNTAIKHRKRMCALARNQNDEENARQAGGRTQKLCSTQPANFFLQGNR